MDNLLAGAVTDAIANTPASFYTPFINQPPEKQETAGALRWLQLPQNWMNLVAQLSLAATLEDLLADPKRLSTEMNKDEAAKMVDE